LPFVGEFITGNTVWDRIHVNLTILLVVRIMFWMLRTKLHVVCILAIEVTTLIESLDMRIFS
jgi:mannose/fructose/N-acetylgalactosamine-specific phosphotransferase system component IID